MNFIFDIGNVLINYKPKLFLRDFLNNENDEKKMLEVIFKSPEWVMLDADTITQDEACEIFCAREPEYKEIIIKIMEKMHEMLTPINSTVALLPKIKEQGHKLFYLSNYHKKLREYTISKYSFFDLFDGGVFSCDISIVKPDQRIYNNLINKYNLNPEECVFFDDTKVNVDAANKLGITGVLFTSSNDVEKYI